MKCEMAIVVNILFQSVKFRFLDLFFQNTYADSKNKCIRCTFFLNLPTDFCPVPRYPMYVRYPRVGPKWVNLLLRFIFHSLRITDLKYFTTENHRFSGSFGSMRPQATEPIGIF